MSDSGVGSGPSRELVEKAAKLLEEWAMPAPGHPWNHGWADSVADRVLSSVWSSLVEEARAEAREENEQLRELLRRCYRVVGPDDLATYIEAALAGSEASPPCSHCDGTGERVKTWINGSEVVRCRFCEGSGVASEDQHERGGLS